MGSGSATVGSAAVGSYDGAYASAPVAYEVPAVTYATPSGVASASYATSSYATSSGAVAAPATYIVNNGVYTTGASQVPGVTSYSAVQPAAAAYATAQPVVTGTGYSPYAQGR